MKDDITTSPAGPAQTTSLYSCFNGKVQVRYTDSISTSRPEKEVFEKAEAYIRLWPEVYNSFHNYVQYITPFDCDLWPDNPYLSSSGCSAGEPGVIYLTTRHPFPLAEAMVHEMAHMKLFSMGIGIEQADAIIENSPHEMYYSPVKETERPMTAIFHAVYSFIHILHLDNLVLKNERGAQEWPAYLAMAKDTLAKMKYGCSIVEKNIKTSAEGKLFVQEFLNKASKTMFETEQIIAAYETTG